MRYIRQESFIGKLAQKKLTKSSVCIIGVGALGSSCAEILTRAGVGKLLLVDNDSIELHNLQRQNLYDESDVGKLKVVAAKNRLTKINKEIKFETFNLLVNAETIKNFKADVFLDCSDNLETSYVISDHCEINKIPLIFGSVIRNEGYIYVYTKGRLALKNVFRSLKTFEKCNVAGIMGTIVSLISSMQVNECIKLLIGKKAERDLIKINLETNDFLKIKV